MTIRTRAEFEPVLRRWLPAFFLVLFVATVLGAFQGYHFHNAFRMGDWLINYQGGMVRRGLLGELFYQLSISSGINPGLYVVLAQTLFYGLFFYFSYRLLLVQKSLVPLLLLIIAPLTFTFHLNDMQGGYRKEIIYFAVLSYTAWSAHAHELSKFKWVFFLVMLVFPLVILTHEMLALYLPYILAIYLMRVGINKVTLLTSAILLVPSGAAFLVAAHYAGTPAYAGEIMNSLAAQGYAVKGGAIAYIGRDLSYAVDKVRSASSAFAIAALLPTLLLCLLPFRPVWGSLRSLFSVVVLRLLLVSSITATLMLSFVAVDWGRFIYIHLVSLFILLLVNRYKVITLHVTDEGKPVVANRWLLVVLLIYIAFWHLGHTTDTLSLFEVINPLNTLFVIAFFLRYRLVSGTSLQGHST